MDFPDRLCCSASLGISVNDCRVMDYSDLCFPSFPALGWYTSFGENGLRFLDFTSHCKQVDVSL